MTIEKKWPKSREELIAYIDEKLAQDHDYDTAVHAMAEITLAAFNFASTELGATGFQASGAGLEFLAASRNMDGPFALIKAEEMLYPQYDIRAQVESYLEKWTPWAAQEAKKKLEIEDDSMVAPRVKRRWQDLAELAED